MKIEKGGYLSEFVGHVDDDFFGRGAAGMSVNAVVFSMCQS